MPVHSASFGLPIQEERHGSDCYRRLEQLNLMVPRNSSMWQPTQQIYNWEVTLLRYKSTPMVGINWWESSCRSYLTLYPRKQNSTLTRLVLILGNCKLVNRQHWIWPPAMAER